MPDFLRGKPPEKLPVSKLSAKFLLGKKPHSFLPVLSELGFAEVSSHGGKLFVKSVQSYDMEKQPHSYIQATLDGKSILLEYTASASGARARKIEVAAWLLHLLSALGANSMPPEIFAFTSEALVEASSQLSEGQAGIAARLDELSSEHDALKGRYSSLLPEHEGQARQLIEATRKAEELSMRLAQLLSLSSDTLDEEVMGWLRAHGGKIDVGQFAQAHAIPAAAVEESLQRLSKGGYIARI